MSAFPLPIPASAPVALPPATGDGVTFLAHCAPELAAYAAPVLQRWVWRDEREAAADGQATFVGFSIYRIRRSGGREFTITAPDYRDREGFHERTTDDLTLSVWVDAAQDDVLRRAGIAGDALDLGSTISIQRAALDVLERRGADPLYLERMARWEDGESGWVLTVAGDVKRRGRRMEDQVAGGLVSLAPHLIPFLQLPGGCFIEFAGDRPRGVWRTDERTLAEAGVRLASEKVAELVHGGRSLQLLDASGNRTAAGAADQAVGAGPANGDASAGSGTRPGDSGAHREPVAERPAGDADVPRLGPLPLPSSDPVEVDLVRDGVRLTAWVAPELAAVARVAMTEFFALGATGLRDGAFLDLAFSAFWLRQTGPAQFAVTSPAFGDPVGYRTDRTDDITKASWAVAMPHTICRAAGLEPQQTYFADEITIQQHVLDGLIERRPVGMTMERLPLTDEQRQHSSGRFRSGWLISFVGGGLSEQQQRLTSIDGGFLFAIAPGLVPFLALPNDTMIHLLGERLLRATMLDPTKLEAYIQAHPGASLGDMLASGEVSRVILQGEP